MEKHECGRCHLQVEDLLMHTRVYTFAFTANQGDSMLVETTLFCLVLTSQLISLSSPLSLHTA